MARGQNEACRAEKERQDYGGQDEAQPQIDAGRCFDAAEIQNSEQQNKSQDPDGVGHSGEEVANRLGAPDGADEGGSEGSRA